MQSDFFQQPESFQRFTVQGQGTLEYFSGWIDRGKGDEYFERLLQDTQWQQPAISIGGKNTRQVKKIPRKQAWYGDENAVLNYSGTRFYPNPWTPLLYDLRKKLEITCRCKFNSVLVNLYRDGRDSVGWHADDEIELGRNPIIASLSLGAERKFSLRVRPQWDQSLISSPSVEGIATGLNNTSAMSGGAVNKSKILHIPLKHGDLLCMKGDSQARLLHAILKDSKQTLPRINLTFRYVNVV